MGGIPNAAELDAGPEAMDDGSMRGPAMTCKSPGRGVIMGTVGGDDEGLLSQELESS